jgi:adenylate cyclase
VSPLKTLVSAVKLFFLPNEASLSELGSSPAGLAAVGIDDLDRVLGGGLPSPSAVLVEGQLGSAKEKLLYSFLRKTDNPDRRVMVTKSAIADVVRDAKANGVEFGVDTIWVAPEGGEARLEMENLATLSFALKEVLKKNSGTRIRIGFDILSSVLMRNSSEGVYRFLDQLIAEVKRYDAVLVATIEPGMHPEPVLASIEHLFDGVLSVVLGNPAAGTGPAVRILRMKGVAVASGETVMLGPATLPKQVAAVEERRLAAIMFTDIVGYTAITQRDEARSMEILKRHNDLLRPVFQKHFGREVKTIGDAFLIEFGSALQALQCAIDAQETLSNYNKDVPSEEMKLKIRIGIHLGDVIMREKDVFGDAVNIASRIQPLAEPGGICVSDQVYGQVRNKVPYELIKIEQVHLKNVSYPVDVYHVFLPWEPRPKVPVHAPEAEGVPLTRRLAILPLSNLTHDPQDDYLVEGMMEELIIGLSNVRDLRVIARSSVMKYKGTTMTVSQIAAELNVGSVVEGSIRKAGTKIRVAIQMIDGKSEEHMFANTYDRDIQDIFAVQTEIAKAVTKALKAKIRSIEKERLEKKPTQSIDAYSIYLKGRFVLHKRTKESMEEASKYFLEAIGLDDHYARAYVGLADSYLLLGSYGYADAKEVYGKAKEYISKALDLDEELAEAHVSLGFLLESYYYDFPAARKEFERAVSLSPGYAQARHWYGMDLALFGEFEEAVKQLEKALESDPLSAQIATMLGNFYVFLGRNDDALFQWNKALMSNPDNVPAYLNRGIFYAEEGKKDKAVADMNKAMELTSGATVVKCVKAFALAALGDREGALLILHEVQSAPQGEYVSPWYLALVHAALGSRDEFFSLAEKAVDERSAEIAALVSPDKMMDQVRGDPRYAGLLRKLGLPFSAYPKEVQAPVPQ